MFVSISPQQHPMPAMAGQHQIHGQMPAQVPMGPYQQPQFAQNGLESYQQAPQIQPQQYTATVVPQSPADAPAVYTQSQEGPGQQPVYSQPQPTGEGAAVGFVQGPPPVSGEQAGVTPTFTQVLTSPYVRMFFIIYFLGFTILDSLFSRFICACLKGHVALDRVS